MKLFKKKLMPQSASQATEQKRFMSPNPFVVFFERLDVRPFYDSTWRIHTELGNDILITRYDDDSPDDLQELLNDVVSEREIKLLDRREVIYYD